MIRVTRLDGTQLYVNAELIETVRSTPDTLLSFTTGRKLVVSEKADEVVRRVIDYRRRISQTALDADVNSLEDLERGMQSWS